MTIFTLAQFFSESATGSATIPASCLSGLLQPPQGTVYDYFVNPKTQKFQPWAELVTDIDYDSSKPMSTVFVPTAETSSLRFFLVSHSSRTMLMARFHCSMLLTVIL